MPHGRRTGILHLKHEPASVWSRRHSDYPARCTKEPQGKKVASMPEVSMSACSALISCLPCIPQCRALWCLIPS